MPIVVTTMSRAALRLSTTKPTSTTKSPAGIHSQRKTWRPSSPNDPPSVAATTIIAATHDATTAPTGIQNALRPSRRPIAAVTTKPASGSAMTRTVSSSWVVTGHPARRRTGRASSAHRVVLVDERRLAVAEDGDDDREADRCLRRRDGHDHERDDRAVTLQRRDERAEGDNRQVHRVEHQLDRHEHGDRVPPREEAERADREQDSREREVRVELVGDPHQPPCPCSRLARNTPPMTAARSSTLTASNARTYRSKRRSARSLVAMRTCSETAPQSVAAATSETSTAMTIAATAAGAAWVWNVSRAEPTFSWVSMIANRIRTLIAPMYTITCAAATIGAPSVTYSAARVRKHTIIARPQRMMSRIETTAMPEASISVPRLATSASSNEPPRRMSTNSAGVVMIAPATAAAIR